MNHHALAVVAVGLLLNIFVWLDLHRRAKISEKVLRDEMKRSNRSLFFEVLNKVHDDQDSADTRHRAWNRDVTGYIRKQYRHMDEAVERLDDDLQNHINGTAKEQ